MTAAGNDDLLPDRDHNTLAIIGCILLAVAIVLMSFVFAMLHRLPDDITELAEPTEPQQLRALILASTSAVLNLVAFLLCGIGLLVPRRPRVTAAIGTIASLLMLLGIFGVLVVGIVSRV